MKASLYNLFYEKKNVVLGYNTMADSYVIVPKTAYFDFLNLSIDSFKEKYPKFYQSFIENGFVIDKSIDELSEIRLQHKIEAFASRNQYLMIYPTQDCNLKCWYCYETHVQNTLMSDKVQDNILKYIERKVVNNEFDSLTITFFGGEPLTNFNNIAYPLSCKIKRLLESNNKVFHTFFITNGTLIDEEMSIKLNEINAAFQITIDGDRNKHNKVRVRKSGVKETYDDIFRSLYYINKNVSSKYPDTSRVITLRINYDNQTLKNIGNILDDIKGLDNNKVGIHLERVWQTQGNEDQKKLLIETIIKFTQNNFTVGYGLFGNRRVSCPAEIYNYAIINYNGLVYRCNGRNLTKDNYEGQLTDDGEIIWKREILRQRLGKSTFENEMCLKCKMLPMCMGPCSQKCIEYDWKFSKSICSIDFSDIPLEEFLSLDFKLRSILLQTDLVVG